jgi:hypothetical protein
VEDGGLALRSRPAVGGFKPPHAALVDDRRGERWGKGVVKASGGDREGERKRIVADVSKSQQVTSEPGREIGFGISLAGVPLIGQAVSGM